MVSPAGDVECLERSGLKRVRKPYTDESRKRLFRKIVAAIKDNPCTKVPNAATDNAEVTTDTTATNVGIELVWRDLTYEVADGRKSKRTILNNLCGEARVGKILAVMGGSGAGSMHSCRFSRPA